MDWLQQLEKLGKDNIYSIDKVEWWLLRFSALQKETHNFIYSRHKFELEDGSIVRLPPLGKKSEQEKFLDLYQALDTISQFHRNEHYFEQELISYHTIIKSKSNLKAWVSKNEDLGADKYVCFFLDYLDYDDDEKVEHLSLFIHSLKEVEIFVDRQDFRFTIEFLEIFNDLFWVQEILPESLAKIRETN